MYAMCLCEANHIMYKIHNNTFFLLFVLCCGLSEMQTNKVVKYAVE